MYIKVHLGHLFMEQNIVVLFMRIVGKKDESVPIASDFTK